MEGTWIASTGFTDFVTLPRTGFLKKYCVCAYTYTDTDIQFSVRALQ